MSRTASSSRWASPGPSGLRAGKLAARAAPKLARAVAKVARKCNSFEADTPVLMADGTLVPIVGVGVGDLVLATDPLTGETTAEAVTDLVRHKTIHDWVDVTIVTKAGTEVITTTDNHPFYVMGMALTPSLASGSLAGIWVGAADLEPGDAFATLGGTAAEVAASTAHTETDWAYNLTVAETHTYYVGNSRVLVHNSTNACDLTATVDKVLSTRKSSILRAPLPKGTPGWNELRPRTMGEIKAASHSDRGMKTVWKLLNDKRFRR